MDIRKPSALDDYLFDLRGYYILENAVAPELVAELNGLIDGIPPLEPGEWLGNAQRRDYTPYSGYELHNCLELGGPLEELIDHPSWIEYMLHWCGDEGSYVSGLFIDECLISVRGADGKFPAHSGNYQGASRGAYLYKDGQFRCGQCNLILALTDIGPGDSPTMIIPGSHKSNFLHPNLGDYGGGDPMDELEGAVELHLKAGDALIFVDACTHGAACRTREGDRRVVIYRYGVSWGRTRYCYEYSQELIDRLTPERRQILQPVPPARPPEKGAADK